MSLFHLQISCRDTAAEFRKTIIIGMDVAERCPEIVRVKVIVFMVSCISLYGILSSNCPLHNSAITYNMSN